MSKFSDEMRAAKIERLRLVHVVNVVKEEHKATLLQLQKVHEELDQAVRELHKALNLVVELQGLIARANTVLEPYLELINRVKE